jgi:simple sugar transport system permease protein
VIMSVSDNTTAVKVLTVLKKLAGFRPARWLSYLLQLGLCLAISIFVGSVLILLSGENPLAVYSGIFQSGFFTPLGFMIAIQRATPLILTSLAAALAFQGGAINMGLEGQFMVGGSIAALVGTIIPEMPHIIAIPIVLLFSALFGALAGLVPAIFKIVSGVSEVITGMIANLIMPSLLSIVLNLSFLRALRASSGQRGIQPWAQLSQFSELTNGAAGTGTHANTGIFIAIGLAIFLALVFKRTRIGYEIRISSANASFADFGGISARRSFILVMMLSGAVAAIGGATEVLGVWRSGASGTISVGYNGLILSLVGGNTFIGSTIAAALYGGLQSGAMNASWLTNVPRPLLDLVVELIVLICSLPSMRMFFSGSSMSDEDRLGKQFTHHA